MYRSYVNTFLRLLIILVLLPFGWLSSTASAQAASSSNGFNGHPVEMRAAAQAELPALISITFDDEDETVYDIGYPILQAQGIPATFYFITNYLNSQWVTRLNDLQNHGWEIGSHTLSHPMLSQISQTQLSHEISQSKQVLQAAGLNVYGFAYPYGDMGSTSAIRDLVAQHYDYARSANPGYNTPDTDPYILYVEFHTRSVPVSEVKAWIDTAIAQRKWLVLGMHYVDHPSGEYSISSADLQEIATYIKERVDTGQIQAMTMRNAYGVINSSPPSAAPVISAVGATPAETQAIIAWATNVPASSIVEYGLTSAYGSVTPEADTSPRVTSHSVMLENLTACTTYHYRTLSRNAGGNQGASGDFTFTTTGCTTQYPQISNIVTVPSASQAVITWTTSTPASTLVEYGQSLPYEYASPETDTSPRVTSHSVTLSGLSACTTYHYRVRSFDAQGGDGTSSDLTFITSGCSETVISSVSAAPSATQAVITWSTNIPASSIVDYSETTPYVYSMPEIDTAPRVTSHSVTLSYLTACTTYHYRARSRVDDGAEAVSADLTFTTAGCSAPVISSVSAAPSANQAVITWTTDSQASSIIEYSETTPYIYSMPETDTEPRVTSHSVTLSYLTACTTYHYRARSRDAYGSEAVSGDLTFTTAGCSAPAISSVSAAPSATQAVITWSTNIPASSIVDYSETTPYVYSMPEIDTAPGVTSHSVTLSYLTACTTYHYRARSRDVYGSAAVSADLTFTTTGCTAAAPALSNFAANAPTIPEAFTWRVEGSPILLPEPPIL